MRYFVGNITDCNGKNLYRDKIKFNSKEIGVWVGANNQVVQKSGLTLEWVKTSGVLKEVKRKEFLAFGARD